MMKKKKKRKKTYFVFLFPHIICHMTMKNATHIVIDLDNIGQVCGYFGLFKIFCSSVALNRISALTKSSHHQLQQTVGKTQEWSSIF